MGELKGVPLRLEIGKRDVQNLEAVLAIRYSAEKKKIPFDCIGDRVNQELDIIHQELFKKANTELKNRTKKVNSWNDFTIELENKNIVLIPFCGVEECEENIKKDTVVMKGDDVELQGAKSLCVPFENNQIEDLKCIK